MTKKRYSVVLPIAGHITVEVEAENEKAAIEEAMASDDAHRASIEDWEMLEKFHSGNVCYCPTPWEAEATLVDGEEDGD
jgi:hypothetical protein